MTTEEIRQVENELDKHKKENSKQIDTLSGAIYAAAIGFFADKQIQGLNIQLLIMILACIALLMLVSSFKQGIKQASIGEKYWNYLNWTIIF